MKKTKALLIALFAATLLVAGCASNSSANDNTAELGVIKSINKTNETQSGVNVGTLIGGVLGGLAGHQVGSGRGNTVATVAGAVGGAVIGTEVDKNANSQMFKIGVKLRDGEMVTVNQKGSAADLHVGQRVKIVDGEVQPA
ncbi:MAG TPA: glycine zipper 2TM domain-containing protein [Gammaproteobacteria bacterium]|jgi:outer membrane lipoprotein SlyB